MVVTTNVNLNPHRNLALIESKNFQVESNITDSKALSFFELLYSYPPKYKIKWNALDELKTNLFTPSRYNELENGLPFNNSIEDWVLPNKEKEIQSNGWYSLEELREGFLDKRYSSNFYKKETKNIQNALSSVPIYAVLNGLNEIILNKPVNLENSKVAKNPLKKLIYNYCGSFDSSFEKRQQVGFFFMSRLDAETYLQEIAKSDMNGTETVGLSIHCISLDSVYNVTRENHPGIDFRIIPDLNEVKRLLTKNLSKSSLIVEDDQQQLRSRRRQTNIFPFLGRLGRLVSPSSSFLKNNEYFKGVPIYVVQTLAQEKNIVAAQYLNTVGLLDNIYSSFTNVFSSVLGFGDLSITQGSIQDSDYATRSTNYVFFDEVSATKFVKNNENLIARYKGSRTANMQSLIRKPKIFVYNLEDFVESWEEKLNSGTVNASVENSSTMNIFDAENTLFIPPENSYREAQSFFESKESGTGTRITKQIFQQINIKYRVFKSFVGIFFSVGY